MNFDQIGGLALTGSAFGVLVVILFRVYILNEWERSTLLDRYQADIAAKDVRIAALDARISALESEIIALRQARDRGT